MIALSNITVILLSSISVLIENYLFIYLFYLFFFGFISAKLIIPLNIPLSSV